MPLWKAAGPSDPEEQAATAAAPAASQRHPRNGIAIVLIGWTRDAPMRARSPKRDVSESWELIATRECNGNRAFRF